jgi:hypothetical protein
MNSKTVLSAKDLNPRIWICRKNMRRDANSGPVPDPVTGSVLLLPGDAESRPAGRGFLHRCDSIHASERRAVTTPGQHPRHGGLRPFEDGLHPSALHVADPAGESQSFRSIEARRAEENALNVAVDTYPHSAHEIWSHRGAKDLRQSEGFWVGCGGKSCGMGKTPYRMSVMRRMG